MNTPNKKEFLRLVESYLDGTATEKQTSTVEKYFDLFSAEPDILDSVDKAEVRVIHDRLKLAIDTKIDQEDKFYPVVPWTYLSIAASVVLAATIGLYFYHSRQPQVKQFSRQVMVADVAPGGNKAVLTLADGKKISLTDAKNGTIANEGGTSILKTTEGQLIYQGQKTSNVIAYNSVATPNGGQYQLTLNDGTKVWLNAASSLKYPLSFEGKERRVELNGEAYFEVAHNKSKPFRVVTSHQEVEVLGTHFDINSYDDEPSTRTSLIEGSVRVTNLSSNKNITILPGQQSILSAAKPESAIKVRNIDIDEAISWKNGYFMFDEESLESILRKIARWYDVDIQYKGLNEKNKLFFSGTLSKYSNVSKVLRKLELTESVHFKIEGRTILVMP
ncbi:FecR domain-containing protein [Pedobacter sp. MC2016-15]|uniref:FecR family protein n=1 Tax=Pedobacter sp. MC2016-15 TaxID=2994473 RepID=UPI002247DF1D|nr:FecR family protein [Pedobacter sp. MC2016-15]MCX2477802.1 FecR domain-containing protein [Pedobacter sp. MC2016-15]